MAHHHATLLALALLPAAWGTAIAAPRQLPRQVLVCDWSQPGSNRYTGSTHAALARLAKHFTPAQMAELRRMVATTGGHSDQVVITRQAITGQQAYHPSITYMHFGAGSVCRSVVRPHLAAPVGALVYMPRGASRGLLRPASCDNWALVHKAQPMRELAGDDGGPGPAPALTTQQRAAGADVPELSLGTPAGGGDSARSAAPGGLVTPPERTATLLTGLSFATAAASTSAAPDSGSGSAAPALAGASGAQPLDGLVMPLPFAPASPVISLPAPLPGVPEPRAGLLLALGLALVATTAHLAKGKA